MNFKKNILIMISLVLLVSFTTGCEKESDIDKAKRQAAENWAQGVIDLAKYKYLESLFEDVQITSGNVIDLDLGDNPASSGTWYMIDEENSEVILKDVIIDNYICNSINSKNGREIECKKNN